MPPDGPDAPGAKRRIQSADDRALGGRTFRERAASHPAIPTAWGDDGSDVTGKYDGEELEAKRARRPTPERLRILERKSDEDRVSHAQFRAEIADRFGKVEARVADRFGKLEAKVGELAGEMRIIPELVSAMQDATSALREHEQILFRANVDVAKARELDRIADHADERRVDRLDELDARAARRKRATILVGKIVGLMTSGALVSAAIHYLIGRL